MICLVTIGCGDRRRLSFLYAVVFHSWIGTLSTRQTFRQYSRMLRSEEKRPSRLTLRMDIRVQCSGVTNGLCKLRLGVRAKIHGYQNQALARPLERIEYAGT